MDPQNLTQRKSKTISRDVTAAMLVYNSEESLLILLLWKTWATYCHCLVHQHDRLITWVKTKNQISLGVNDLLDKFYIMNKYLLYCKLKITWFSSFRIASKASVGGAHWLFLSLHKSRALSGKTPVSVLEETKVMLWEAKKNVNEPDTLIACLSVDFKFAYQKRDDVNVCSGL